MVEALLRARDIHAKITTCKYGTYAEPSQAVATSSHTTLDTLGQG